MSMMREMLAGYDVNLPLRDALDDPDQSPDRRALAAVSFRQALDDAYLSAHELLEAFRLLETDARLSVAPADSESSRAIDAILQADGDDYQRRLYWLLSETPVADAVLDLVWLTETLRGRAAMFRVIGEAGTRLPPMPEL
jgi:hypothetical protein